VPDIDPALASIKQPNITSFQGRCKNRPMARRLSANTASHAGIAQILERLEGFELIFQIALITK
jgi:hypothetical protein